MVKNRRPVLCADIVPLTIERGRIMDREKDLQEVSIPDNGRVECDPNGLGVASRSSADGLICRPVRLASDISGLDGTDAMHLVVDRLQTPKASPRKRRDFFLLH
jgi:hypothetical protein